MTDYLTNPATLGLTGFGGADESPRVSYTLRVNGLERPVNEAWIGESLLYVLRERLGLAGAKGGCDQGECGACSVQLDGQLTAACLVPAALAADSEIRTVEGLASDGTASDVQRALAESTAVQCGYCVPGLAMAVHDLLERNHKPTDLQAREALCGNLCRCTGYQGALAAVQAVAQARAAEAAAAVTDGDAAERATERGTDLAGAEPGAEEGQGGHGDSAPVAAPGAGAGPEPELPVYIEIPAQQQGTPQPPAEVDPLFGPMDGLTASQAVPQYAYPQGGGADPHVQGQIPQQQFDGGPSTGTDAYQTPAGAHLTEGAHGPQGGYTAYSEGGTPYHPGDYGSAGYQQTEHPGNAYPQSDYAQADYSPSDYPQAADYQQQSDYQPAQHQPDPYQPGGYPEPGTPPDPAPGVYLLPHQHAPAPETGS